MGLKAEVPAAVYAMHHAELGAVQIGACMQPQERRIRSHERKDWVLLLALPVPTGRDAEAIERMVLDKLKTRAWVPAGMGARNLAGLPGHGTIAGCQACGTPPATAVLRESWVPFLSKAQMPQGGWTETFDARLVSPERAGLALHFAEKGYRARYYPEAGEGVDAFAQRRAAIEQRVRDERWSRPVY
ncbi:hypothetical protein OG357_05350 [Streptomyces sp. NBC_01255]|uniref:hypothetical protein n=1 Tax=Streptomyces sp. NBC_01255 TaxID=2903798 RepID=UPI002E2F1D1A|nr:hypothetical protein [Streptomyces sp. NBC_01255]